MVADIEAKAKENFCKAVTAMRAFKSEEPWTLEHASDKWDDTKDGAEPRNLWRIGATNADAEFADVALPAGETPKDRVLWFDEQPTNVTIPWLIDEAVPEGGVGFIGARWGKGKSFVAIEMMLCKAIGVPFFGREIAKRGGVHYVAAEGGYGMQARYRAALDNKFAELAIAAGLDPKHLPVSYEKDAPADLLTKEGRVAFIDQLKAIDKRMREQYGVPLSLVIVDTFGQTFTLKDENAAAEVSKATKAMKQIASVLGVTVVSLHHYGKDEKRDMRGSSAFYDNADFVLVVKEDGKLELDKCKDALQGITLGYFNMETVDVGVKANGDAITSLYVKVRSEWPDDLSELEPSGSESDFEQSVAAMLEAKGVDQAPNGEGAPCKTVRLEDVRQEFYRLWGQAPEANSKAFRRVLNNLPAGYQRGKWDGCEWLWRSPAT